jgi:hypothetical protein
MIRNSHAINPKRPVRRTSPIRILDNVACAFGGPGSAASIAAYQLISAVSSLTAIVTICGGLVGKRFRLIMPAYFSCLRGKHAAFALPLRL